eukprot:TRINITY_DN6669_c0_g2_i1.p1 TRINITY_DN6669_c0_g2~~TRINITY_DN6669_c0_g2_i1.p1  ORF type:complete len:1313 (-),score=333.32 TRINITY_DN6669_c0_g2_i1:75-4013(-)
MLRSLVGSEMCIRDSTMFSPRSGEALAQQREAELREIFEMVDTDKSESIDKAEMFRFFMLCKGIQLETNLNEEQRTAINIQVDSCWRRLDKDADSLVTWSEFRGRVNDFLDTFDGKNKKMRKTGDQESINVKDFLFKDETGRNAGKDREAHKLKLPQDVRNLVTYVEQMLQFRSNRDSEKPEEYDCPAELIPGQSGPVGKISLDSMTSILINDRNLGSPPGYHNYYFALGQIVEMMRMGAMLGSDSDRYAQSELLLFMFHKMVECGMLATFNLLLKDDTLPVSSAELTVKHDPIYGGNPLLFNSTSPLQRRTLKFLEYFIPGPEVPDLPENDDNHPSNFFYKKKVEVAGITDGLKMLLSHGRLDKLFTVVRGMKPTVTDVLVELADCHQAAQILLKAHTYGRTSVLFEFSSDQHLHVPTPSLLSEIILSPSLWEAYNITRAVAGSKTSTLLLNPPAPTTPLGDYRHLVNVAAESLKVQRSAYRVLGIMAGYDTAIRDHLFDSKHLITYLADEAETATLIKYLSACINPLVASQDHPFKDLQRVVPDNEDWLVIPCPQTGQVRSVSVASLFRDRVDISKPSHKRAEVEYVTQMCKAYQESLNNLSQVPTGDIAQKDLVMIRMLERMEWMECFIELSKKTLDVDKEAMCLLAHMCGESHSEPPVWVREVRHQKYEHLVSELARLAGQQLVSSDDPWVLVEACLCAAHLVPAIRVRKGAAQCHEFVCNVVERLQGVGLAALFMQNPLRDASRRGFNGATGNDDREAKSMYRGGYHLSDNYDGKVLFQAYKIGVWCPKPQLIISPINLQVVGSAPCDMRRYGSKAADVHKKVLRTLLQLLEPTTYNYWQEALSEARTHEKQAEYKQNMDAVSISGQDLKVLIQGFLPYLYEIIEDESHTEILAEVDLGGTAAPGNSIGLRRLAMEILEKIVMMAGEESFHVLLNMESRLLPYMQLLIHQSEDETLRWYALRVLKHCSCTKLGVRLLPARGTCQALCSTLRHFKSYNAKTVELYHQVKPNFNSAYAIDVIDTLIKLTRDPIKSIGGGVDCGFDFYGLENIRSLSATMCDEQGFWSSRYQIHMDLRDKVQELVSSTRNTLGACAQLMRNNPNSYSSSQHTQAMVVFREKEQLLVRIENCLRAYDERAAQRNDVAMEGQFVPARQEVRFKLIIWYYKCDTRKHSNVNPQNKGRKQRKVILFGPIERERCKLETMYSEAQYKVNQAVQGNLDIAEKICFYDDHGGEDNIAIVTQDDLDRALKKYDRQGFELLRDERPSQIGYQGNVGYKKADLSLIHISEPTRLLSISYAVFCLKKKKKT